MNTLSVLTWISNPENQKTLAFIGGGLVIAIGGAWQVYLHFSGKPKGSPTIGGNVLTASTGGIAFVATGTVTIGINHELYDSIKKQYDLTDTALQNFFKILQEKKVPVEDLDHKLREIAEWYNTLHSQLNDHMLSDNDPKIQTLKQQAKDALVNGDLDTAERLLQDAIKVDEEEERLFLYKRRLSRASSLAELGSLKYMKLAYAEASDYYRKASDLVPEQEFRILAFYLNTLGRILYESGRYTEAEVSYQRSLAIIKQHIGPDNTDVAGVLDNLVALYEVKNQYIKAEELAKSAINIWKNNPSGNNPHMASSYNNLGLIYESLGRYSESESYHNLALEFREKMLGDIDCDRAKTLNNLGNQYCKDVAISLNNLAKVYYKQNKLDDAESRYQRALDIRKNVLGSWHPEVAQSYNNLAEIYRKQNKYSKAIDYYLYALAIWEKAFGKEHNDVANCLNNLGLVYAAEGKYEEAESSYSRAVSIWKLSIGIESRDVATGYNNLAELYRSSHKYKMAESFYQKALDIRKKVLGQEHEDVAQSLNNLGLFYLETKRYDEALVLFKQAQTIWTKKFGGENIETANAINNQAEVYRLQGLYKDAEKLYNQILAIPQENLHHDSPIMVIVLNNLALVYYAQTEYSKAEPFFEKALVTIEQAPGPESIYVTVALGLQYYVKLLRFTGRDNEANLVGVRINAAKAKHSR